MDTVTSVGDDDMRPAVQRALDPGGARCCDEGEPTLVLHRPDLPYSNDSTGDHYVWRT